MEPDLASSRVGGLVGVLDRVRAQTRNPGASSNHLALREGAGLVAANIRHGAQCLERLEVAHNHIAPHHPLRPSRHGDGQHNDQAGGDHGQSRGNSVDDDLAPRVELVRAQNHDGKDDSDGKQQDSQLAQLLLQRRADADAQEPADKVAQRQRIRLHVPRRMSPAVRPALDWSHAGILCPQSRGNGADLGGRARREDDALRPALGDRRAAVRHVEPVSGPGVLGEQGAVLRLADGQALAREQRLVRLEVPGLREPDVGGDRVPGLDLDEIPGHELSGRHHRRLAASHDGGGGRAEGPQGVHRLLGRVLLEEADHHVEQDNGGDDAALDVAPDAETYRHGHDEHLQCD